MGVELVQQFKAALRFAGAAVRTQAKAGLGIKLGQHQRCHFVDQPVQRRAGDSTRNCGNRNSTRATSRKLRVTMKSAPPATASSTRWLLASSGKFDRRPPIFLKALPLSWPALVGEHSPAAASRQSRLAHSFGPLFPIAQPTLGQAFDAMQQAQKRLHRHGLCSYLANSGNRISTRTCRQIRNHRSFKIYEGR